MTLTTTTSASRMRASASGRLPASPATSLIGLWRVVTHRRRRSAQRATVQAGMPQRFGDHFRWPDGTWTHSG